jgi:hypothetical protein
MNVGCRHVGKHTTQWHNIFATTVTSCYLRPDATRAALLYTVARRRTFATAPRKDPDHPKQHHTCFRRVFHASDEISKWFPSHRCGKFGWVCPTAFHTPAKNWKGYNKAPRYQMVSPLPKLSSAPSTAISDGFHETLRLIPIPKQLMTICHKASPQTQANLGRAFQRLPESHADGCTKHNVSNVDAIRAVRPKCCT